MSLQTSAMPDLSSYDYILVGFSGGKDSIACVLLLLMAGVTPERIILCHHEVDGDGPLFMDWACTPGYVKAFAAAFGMRVYFSYRQGGLYREMHRHDQATAPVIFQDLGWNWRQAGGLNGPLGTRLRFPQNSHDLRVRYCSPSAKIGVMDSLICNQDDFLGKRTLVVTGERAQESSARANYATFEPHRTDTRHGTRRRRHVDHWRPAHGLAEATVWDLVRDFGVNPHVAYSLGWSRLSCMTCIFISADCWATIRLLFPERFEIIAEREHVFGCTIQRTMDIRAYADRGTPYAAALSRPDLVAQANDPVWRMPLIVSSSSWSLPAGAFGEGGGPS